MPPDTLATVRGIRRILLKGALLLTLVLGVVAASPSLYRFFKIQRYSFLAEQSWKKKDLATAIFYAQLVRSLDSDNDKAVGLIARITTETNHPAAIFWLGRWVELRPKDPVRLAALGKMAVLRNQLQAAEICLKNLKKIPEASPSEIAELESTLLVRQGKTGQALQLLKEASSSRNATPQLVLNYGILLLSQPGKAEQQEGISLLQKLAHDPGSAFIAIDNLIHFAFGQQNRELAEQSASLLAQKPDLSLREYLLLKQVHLFLNGKLPDSFHQEMILRLNRHKGDIYPAVTWLLDHGQPDEADNLIAYYKNKGEALDIINPLHARRMAVRGEWKDLLEALQDPEWKVLGAMRYAYLIQACRALGGPELASSKKRYKEALLLELRQHPQALFELDNAARRWNWKEERLDMWESLVGQDRIPTDYLRLELILAQKKRDTFRLYGLGMILLHRFPEDKVLQNNLITYGLLLDLFPEQCLEKARKLVETDPDNKSLRTTYALALLKNGQLREALAQYADFSEAQLQKPEVAAYYAMALLADGQKQKAAPYLVLAQKAVLLPEEESLLSKASSPIIQKQ